MQFHSKSQDFKECNCFLLVNSVGLCLKFAFEQNLPKKKNPLSSLQLACRFCSGTHGKPLWEFLLFIFLIIRVTSLVPRPRPAFRRLRYGKAGEGPGTFSHMSDVTGRQIMRMWASCKPQTTSPTCTQVERWQRTKTIFFIALHETEVRVSPSQDSEDTQQDTRFLPLFCFRALY